MRVMGRNDVVLMVGLTIALFVILSGPVSRFLDYVREIEMTRGSQGAVDNAAGSVVATHRVYGDANHSEELRLFDCAHLSAAVVPAVRAGAV